MHKLLNALTLALLVTGCATVKPPSASYNEKVRYPAVAVVINDGVVNSTPVWTGYMMMNVVDQTSVIIKEELAKTGVFEAVQLNNPYQEVVLNLTLARKVTDDNIVKSILVGGTVALVPTTKDVDNKARIEVRVRAETLRAYEYTFKTTERVFLLGDAYASRREVASAVWALFLADAQKDKLFETAIPESLARQRASVK